MSRFLAIDFETADTLPDSACSVGLVLVENGAIVREEVRLIRPPRRRMMFTHIHGLRWEDVEHAPHFGDVWPTIAPLFEGVEFLAAHNASFDKNVLAACCQTYGVTMPAIPFRCTVVLARQTWKAQPNNLKAVCQRLEIELNHHEALSDARACAQIVLRAQAHASALAVEALAAASAAPIGPG
jgi:DNA polymerase-3 subunit epsilon